VRRLWISYGLENAALPDLAVGMFPQVVAHPGDLTASKFTGFSQIQLTRNSALAVTVIL
jgi:hypothetical protein